MPRKGKSPSDDARAMRRTAREVLNELRWRDPNRLPDAVIVYRDRARLEGEAPSMRCHRCNGLFEIAWNEPYLASA